MYFVTNKEDLIIAASNKFLSEIGWRDACSISSMMKDQIITLDELKDELKIPTKNLEFSYKKSILHSAFGEFALYALSELQVKTDEEKNLAYLKKIKENTVKTEDNEFAIPALEADKEEKTAPATQKDELLKSIENIEVPNSKEIEEATKNIEKNIDKSTEKLAEEIIQENETANKTELKIVDYANSAETESEEKEKGLKKLGKKLFPWSKKDYKDTEIELEDNKELDLKSGSELEDKETEKIAIADMKPEEEIKIVPEEDEAKNIATVKSEPQSKIEIASDEIAIPPIPDHIKEESLREEPLSDKETIKTEEKSIKEILEEAVSKAEEKAEDKIENIEAVKLATEDEIAVPPVPEHIREESLKEDTKDELIKLADEQENAEVIAEPKEEKPEKTALTEENLIKLEEAEAPLEEEPKESAEVIAEPKEEELLKLQETPKERDSKETVSLEDSKQSLIDQISKIGVEESKTEKPAEENIQKESKKEEPENVDEVKVIEAQKPELQEQEEPKDANAELLSTQALYNLAKHEVSNIDFKENAAKLSIDIESYKMLTNSYLAEIKKYKGDLENRVPGTINMLTDAGELLSLNAITKKLIALKNSSNPSDILNKITLISSMLKMKLEGKIEDSKKEEAEPEKDKTKIFNEEALQVAKPKEEAVSKQELYTDDTLKEPKVSAPKAEVKETKEEELQIDNDVIELTDASTLLKEIAKESVNFDPNRAAEELNLPKGLILEFVEDFIKQAKEHLPILINSYNSNDLTKIQTTAHMLKGAASNLRLNTIAENLFKIQKENNIENDVNLIKQFAAKLKGLESEVNSLEKNSNED